MANDCPARPHAQFNIWPNNFAIYVNGYLADMGLAAGAVGPELRVKVGNRTLTPPVPGWPHQKT